MELIASQNHCSDLNIDQDGLENGETTPEN